MGKAGHSALPEGVLEQDSAVWGGGVSGIPVSGRFPPRLLMGPKRPCALVSYQLQLASFPGSCGLV